MKYYKTDFEKAFFSLPANRLQEVQEEIIRVMEWTRSIYYAKRSGRTKIKSPEKALLHQIFINYGIKL